MANDTEHGLSAAEEGKSEIERLVRLAINDGEYLGRHGAGMEPAEVIKAREACVAARVSELTALSATGEEPVAWIHYGELDRARGRGVAFHIPLHFSAPDDERFGPLYLHPTTSPSAISEAPTSAARKSCEGEFMKLVADARARYDAMTPEQKADHDKAQSESWARGMTGGDGTTTRIKPAAAAEATVREVLIKALTPFAHAADNWVGMGDTRTIDEDGSITVAHLRGALAALLYVKDLDPRSRLPEASEASLSARSAGERPSSREDVNT